MSMELPVIHKNGYEKILEDLLSWIPHFSSE